MTNEKMTPLRERMIEDRIRGMGDKAQKAHIRATKTSQAFSSDPRTRPHRMICAPTSCICRYRGHAAHVQCPDHGTAVPVWYDLRARGDEAVHAIPHATPQTTEVSKRCPRFWRQPLGLASSIVPRSAFLMAQD